MIRPTERGNRKLSAARLYLVLCFAFSMAALWRGAALLETAAVCLSWASGLASFVWGNVRAKDAAPNGAARAPDGAAGSADPRKAFGPDLVG